MGLPSATAVIDGYRKTLLSPPANDRYPLSPSRKLSASNRPGLLVREQHDGKPSNVRYCGKLTCAVDLRTRATSQILSWLSGRAARLHGADAPNPNFLYHFAF